MVAEPLLSAAGIEGVAVITNDWAGGAMAFPNGHPECIWCGTCKMQAVLRYRERGPVAFVGEGQTDRYGALYADVTFAKQALVAFCRADGVPFVPVHMDAASDLLKVNPSLKRAPSPFGGADVVDGRGVLNTNHHLILDGGADQDRGLRRLRHGFAHP